MQTVDFHSHLLGKNVKFNRPFDRFAIAMFARKFDISKKELFKDPFNGYKYAFAGIIAGSKFVKKSVVFGIDARLTPDLKEIFDPTVCASNSDVHEFAKEFPTLVVPFFSINPMRENSCELVQKYVDLGFVGAKMMPNFWQIDLNQDKFRPYFELLAKLKLPVIVHIGSENALPSKQEFERLSQINLMLECGVIVVVAHMALSFEIYHPFRALSSKASNINDDYFTLLKMLEKHENLYADLSAILTPVRARILPALAKESQIHHKLLFGSDFPVPYSCFYNSYDLNFKQRHDLHTTKNPLDRNVKALEFYFGSSSKIFTNYNKILDL